MLNSDADCSSGTQVVGLYWSEFETKAMHGVQYTCTKHCDEMPRAETLWVETEMRPEMHSPEMRPKH